MKRKMGQIVRWLCAAAISMERRSSLGEPAIQPPRDKPAAQAAAQRTLWPGWVSIALIAYSSGALAECGPYRVGYHALGQLYEVDSAGKAQGIDKDVMEELARRSGCTFVTEVNSRVRIWEAIRNGRLDLTTSVLPTPDRAALGDIVVYKTSRNRLLVRAHSAVTLDSLGAFVATENARLVVVRSFMYAEPFDDWIAKLRDQKKLVEVVDFDTALRVFAAGRVDAMIVHSGTEERIDLAMASSGGYRIVKVDGAHTFPSGILISKLTVKDEDQKLLRRVLVAMVQDGTVDRIVKHYQGDGDEVLRATSDPRVNYNARRASGQ